MRRSALLKFREKVWLPVGDAGLEVAIVPGASVSAAMMYVEPGNEDAARRACTDFFQDFRGLEDDDGNPVPNSLEERLFLWQIPRVKSDIVAKCSEISEEVFKGEEPAASD